MSRTTTLLPASVVDHGLIRSLGDFLMLDIIDWDRCHPYETVQQIMRSTASFLINRYTYIVVNIDITAYPQRDDFPGWEHSGAHELKGKWYWNHFHHDFEGTLCFGDSPDFAGVIHRNGQEHAFMGDIGKVSPLTFKQVLAEESGIMWISVRTEHRQIILEPRPFPPDSITLALRDRLDPLNVLWHEMYGYVFLKHNGENFLLGIRTALAKASLERVRRAVEHVLPQSGATVIHDDIAPLNEEERA